LLHDVCYIAGEILIFALFFIGFRKIVNTATVGLIGITLFGWGLSKLQDNTPIVLNDIRSLKTGGHDEATNL